MGFEYHNADPDSWLLLALKSNLFNHYQHALLCTDDSLAIMEEPERFIREELGKIFTLKENSIASPEQCLGKKVS